MQKFLFAVIISLAISGALAGTGTLNYSPSGSSPMRVTTDGSSNNLNNVTIWDQSAGANGLGITTNNAAKMEGVGSAGSATGGILTVQGVASMTPVQVSQATASSLNATVVGTGTFAVQAAGAANVTPTDCSTTISSGGTAQNIISASSTLHGFTIANIDTTSGSGEPVWISFTTTAAASTTQSYPLAAPTASTFANLSSFTTPLGFGINHAVSVIAATTGHKISCTQW